MKKWYSIDLNQKDAEKLQKYLYETDVRFEISGNFELVHFEIEMEVNGEMFNRVSNYISNEIFKDSISEVK